MLTLEFAQAFADDWIASWNAHDLPRILAHYTDDFEMASPKIATIADEPSGLLRGKAAVAAYWAKALSLVPDLHFEQLAVFVSARSVAVQYRNHAGRVAVETFEFNDAGAVVRAAAHYS